MTGERIAALGEQVRVRGFALAGVQVLPAEDPDAVRAAWAALDDDVTVLILTPAAAAALDRVPGRGRPLTVVLPS